MRRIPIALALLLFYGDVLAQAPWRIDSAPVHLRVIPEARIREYQANKSFAYEYVPAAPQSAWDRFWYRVWRNLLGGLSIGQSILAYMLLAAALALVIYALTSLGGLNKTGLFSKGGSQSTAGPSLQTENRVRQLDREIEKAIQSRDFRLAVRLHYLKLLHLLSEQGLIGWQSDKTNSAYLRELAGTSLEPAFSELTRQYEGNWYGSIPIDGTKYEFVAAQFSEAARQIASQ